MSGTTVHFMIIPRRHRAEHLVPTIRRCSKRFKSQYVDGDTRGMENTSKKAWDAMTNLFEILRNEQDHGHLNASFVTVGTSFLVSKLSQSEQANMISASRIDRSHQSYSPLSLRETLNKITHYDTALASRLCKNAAVAVKAIA